MTSTKTIFACLAALGLSALSACVESDSGDPGPPDGEYYYIADYTVTGDTLFMHMPADTIWECWLEDPLMTIREPETGASRFEISGNRLMIFDATDTNRINISGEESWAVLRRHTILSRIGNGTGIEGRWKWEGTGHTVFAESPDRKVRADVERNDSLMAIELTYLAAEIEYSRGIVRGRIRGDHAGLFLATWNGAFAFDSLDVSDSSQYAVDVTRLDSGTVRLTGRETGETVTITYAGPAISIHYASDRSGRIPYSEAETHRSCDIEEWYVDFLEENRRYESPIAKVASGSRNPGKKPGIRQNPRKSPFFGLLQGFPLNQPHSLLN